MRNSALGGKGLGEAGDVGCKGMKQAREEEGRTYAKAVRKHKVRAERLIFILTVGQYWDWTFGKVKRSLERLRGMKCRQLLVVKLIDSVWKVKSSWW